MGLFTLSFTYWKSWNSKLLSTDFPEGLRRNRCHWKSNLNTHCFTVPKKSPHFCDAICCRVFSVLNIFRFSWGQAETHLLFQPLCQSSFPGSLSLLANLINFPSRLIQASGNKWLRYKLLGFNTRHLLPPAWEPQLAAAHSWRLRRYYKQSQNTAAIWHYKARLR